MTAGRTNSKQRSKHWCTPPKYIEAIELFFSGIIDLDPCSNEYSLVNSRIRYALPERDGLHESWNYKNIFVNPPYGADTIRKTTIKHWIYKCEEANRIYNSEVLALVPVATNTRHWKDYIFGKASCICFLYDTRLKFYIDGMSDDKGAPMSCAMVYWGINIKKFIHIFSKYGAALDISSAKGKLFG
ncbi:DNA N-6-adenine-methyltransferase [uncultured Desulfovibrio sp.]|uniref:DNA N-6-adenine-methyltransferase n=1 Tax=uncultured Desulfovibrio sp. TaxID=167968 RepID=UPI0025CF7AD5|nr:DNA N-6-adenine-methyltransferase [uncultured Desulfovibrio sp.]